jgi:hypothetical protein
VVARTPNPVTVAIVIALAALVLISLLAFIGLAVLGAALFMWMGSGRQPVDAPSAPSAPAEPIEYNAFDDAGGDDPATEVFNRGHMFAVYDSDDMDATEVVRMDGGILLDGSIDPALVRSHAPPHEADKD